tara:strand:+ start:1557 stop:1790 length:234 start_codon:yes stop_codon:yes gene_type:complete
MINIICRESIIGFSFLEISINKEETKSISKNVKSHSNTDEKSLGLLINNLYEEIIEITIQIKNIINLSIRGISEGSR